MYFPRQHQRPIKVQSELGRFLKVPVLHSKSASFAFQKCQFCVPEVPVLRSRSASFAFQKCQFCNLMKMPVKKLVNNYTQSCTNHFFISSHHLGGGKEENYGGHDWCHSIIIYLKRLCSTHLIPLQSETNEPSVPFKKNTTDHLSYGNQRKKNRVKCQKET